MKSFNIIFMDDKGSKAYNTTNPVVIRAEQNKKNGDWFQIILRFPSG